MTNAEHDEYEARTKRLYDTDEADAKEEGSAVGNLRAQLERQTPEHLPEFDWLWQLMSRDTAPFDTMLFVGFLAAAAAELPDATFWELVKRHRKIIL